MSHAPLIVDSTGEELLYSTPLPTHSWNSPQEFLLVPGYQSDATLRYSCNGHILILRCPHIVSSLGTLLDSWPDPNSQFFVTLIYSNQVTNRTRYVYSFRIWEHIERSTSIIFCRPCRPEASGLLHNSLRLCQRLARSFRFFNHLHNVIVFREHR